MIVDSLSRSSSILIDAVRSLILRIDIKEEGSLRDLKAILEVIEFLNQIECICGNITRQELLSGKVEVMK